MAFDYAAGYVGALSDPVSIVAAVTPNDGADLPFVSTCIFVGAAGTVTFTPARTSVPPAQVVGSSPGPTFPNVTLTLPAGWHPIRASRILATGTAATGIAIGTVA